MTSFVSFFLYVLRCFSKLDTTHYKLAEFKEEEYKVGNDGLSIQNINKINPQTLSPLTPEVMFFFYLYLFFFGNLIRKIAILFIKKTNKKTTKPKNI